MACVLTLLSLQLIAFEISIVLLREGFAIWGPEEGAEKKENARSH